MVICPTTLLLDQPLVVSQTASISIIPSWMMELISLPNTGFLPLPLCCPWNWVFLQGCTIPGELKRCFLCFCLIPGPPLRVLSQEQVVSSSEGPPDERRERLWIHPARRLPRAHCWGHPRGLRCCEYPNFWLIPWECCLKGFQVFLGLKTVQEETHPCWSSGWGFQVGIMK